MKIIIIGAGKVGFAIAENLANEDYDVTIIDKDLEALERAENSLDVMCLKGNGVSANALLNAGADHADLLVAVTESDVVNMVCCLTAKKLGVSHTIARVRDPEYAQELSLIKEQLGLDYVINPEQAAADEIARSLSFSSAINVESFAKGRVRLLELRVTPEMSIVGKSIMEVDRETYSSILIGVVIRDNEVIIPKGSFKIKEDDEIYVIGKPSNVYNFCKLYGKYPQKIKNVMIIGGGRISYYLSRMLLDMGMKVKIIEIDKEKCIELSEALPEILVINGDGTDEEVLNSENIGDMDGFVAITGIDEENLMSSLVAKQIGIKKIVTKISRTNYTNIVKNLGIDTIISPKLITAHQILKFVRGKAVETLFKIIEGQAEIIELFIDKPSKYLNKPIKDLHISKDVIIATIIRKNEMVVPHGSDSIKLGDRIIVITKDRSVSSIDEIAGTANGGIHNEFFNGLKKLGGSSNM